MKSTPEIDTRQWLKKVVIGLDLCPFAATPNRTDRIRFVTTEKDLVEEVFYEELDFLTNTSPIRTETTLLIINNGYSNFEEFLTLVAWAEQAIVTEGYEGIYQVAHFHPQYQFAHLSCDDIRNHTNRSPYPVLHLLREESIEKARKHYPNVEQIPSKNEEKLLNLTPTQFTTLWNILRPDSTD